MVTPSPMPVGSFRTERPMYRNLLPPCNHDCPAGENIQQWLSYAGAGEYRKAWQVIVETIRCPPSWGARAITLRKRL